MMTKKTAAPPRHYEVHDENGKELGSYSVDHGVITVYRPGHEPKTAQLGSVPADAYARMMLK